MRIEIKKSDLRREPYKASGPGGQHRNKTESAIRLVHIPTGIVAQSCDERCQHSNERTALKMLVAKIMRHEEEKLNAKKQDEYNAKPDVSFGNQIRTYFLHGQARVKDHRTGVESDPKSVLSGKIDDFLIANLKKDGV